jgi:hypothetical protein
VTLPLPLATPSDPLSADERLDLAEQLRLGVLEPEDLGISTVAARRAILAKRPATARRRDEAVLERRVLLDLGREPDVLLCRNEVGLGYRRALLGSLCPTCRVAAKPHTIHFGIGVGSPDLVGIAAGRFVGLELKVEGRAASPDQVRWHEAATKRGAVVGVVRSVDEARAVIVRARQARP